MHHHGPTDRCLYYAGTSLGKISYEDDVVWCHFPLSKPEHRARQHKFGAAIRRIQLQRAASLNLSRDTKSTYRAIFTKYLDLIFIN